MRLFAIGFLVVLSGCDTLQYYSYGARSRRAAAAEQAAQNSADDRFCRSAIAYDTCRAQIDQGRLERALTAQLEADERSAAVEAAIAGLLIGFTPGLQWLRPAMTMIPPPQPAAPSTAVYTMPSGRSVSCTTMGNQVSCF